LAVFLTEGLYKKKQQHRQKRRENSAIIQGKGRKRRHTKSKSKSYRKKSEVKMHRPVNSYSKIKQIDLSSKIESTEPGSSMVDDFCKDLYEFLGESRTENKSEKFAYFKLIYFLFSRNL
jgi:hypothetical protein